MIRKNHWYNIGRPVTEKEFYAIIRGVNNLLANEIALGHNVIFPERMGRLELRKHPCKATIKNGKLKVNFPKEQEKRARNTLAGLNEHHAEIGEMMRICIPILQEKKEFLAEKKKEYMAYQPKWS